MFKFIKLRNSNNPLLRELKTLQTLFTARGFQMLGRRGVERIAGELPAALHTHFNLSHLRTFARSSTEFLYLRVSKSHPSTSASAGRQAALLSYG